MKKIKVFLTLAVLAGVSVALFVSNDTAGALIPADPTSTSGGPKEVRTPSAGCGGIETSIIDCNSNSGNPVIGIMLTIINFLAVGVGIAVVGGIIWGGMIYASSNGDSSKVQQAKTIIVNAVIGLLLFIFMYAIINYLVPGGLFTKP